MTTSDRKNLFCAPSTRDHWEAEAKRRLADEYDAAQERGEVRTQADNQAFSKAEKASGSKLVSPKELHEARQVRDAEQADPGIVRRTLDEALEVGEGVGGINLWGIGELLPHG